MSSHAGPLILIAARARRRPGRWLLTVVGVALATAFAGAVAAEGTITGEQAARSVLSGLSPLDRTVRVTWQGPVTEPVRRQALALFGALHLPSPSEVVLLSPVRLSGIVVQPAAIAPLAGWTSGPAPETPDPCRASSCPVLLAGGTVDRTRLTATGAQLRIVGNARLRSAAPLGFVPGTQSAQPPLVVTGDARGLDALTALSGVPRTHSWLALMPTSGLGSWQLRATERRLQLAQATLLASGSPFSFSAPFTALDAARAQAAAAPRRLLLAGGGAIAALAVFVILAAGGLRRDQRAELERLRVAGATTSQCLMFALGEAAWLCAVGLIAGAAVAVAVAALLAGAAGVPVGGVLAHSLLTPLGATALVAGWVCATALIALVLLASGRRAADVLAIAAVAALALALTRPESRNDPLPVLLAPLCCLAFGVLVFRAAAGAMQAAERLSRRGPVLARLALVSLARAPAAPALAIAFIAVSIGLGGFALAYRATLLRGTSDQAADQVPLDATVSPAADFTTPLELAPLSRWRSISGGEVLPVRRTEASFLSGGGTVTVPALGVPATALTQLHGWRAGDGSAPLRTLARRLVAPGPVRILGPRLPADTRYLSIRAQATAIAVTVTADLRDRAGTIRQLTLGVAGEHQRTLRAPLPAGSWTLEALELDEPVGLEITDAHQNAESLVPSTQSQSTVVLGPVVAWGAGDRPLMSNSVAGWRGVGAASAIRRGGGAGATRGPGGGSMAGTGLVVRFAASGLPGLVRPAQPSDWRPVPVLVDPATAAASAGGGRLALSVDGLPVSARVVGVLARFPTLAADAAGFVVADEATLASALDAQLPGQGRPDELWVSTHEVPRLAAALRSEPFAELGVAFRTEIEHRLRSAPIARALLGTLIAAAVLSGALAVMGLLVALLGGARDRRVQSDLAAQGLGPRSLRVELGLRLLLAGAAGVCVGLAIAVVLTRLAVAAVRAGTVATPRPALVTVAPWGALAAWGLAALAVLAAASFAATRLGRTET